MCSKTSVTQQTPDTMCARAIDGFNRREKSNRKLNAVRYRFRPRRDRGLTPLGVSGFTLVEILVVVSIIAIMAAILMPVFFQARDSARRNTCASNQRQIGVALLTYSDDYGGCLPPSAITISYTGETRTWDQLLMPYVLDTRIFKCPTDLQKRPAGYLPRSYALNDQMAASLVLVGGSSNAGRGVPVGRVPAPQSFVCVSELQSYNGILNNIGEARMQLRTLTSRAPRTGSPWPASATSTACRRSTRRSARSRPT